ncbi:MAG: molybdopterin molybdotransferase MoeA [Bacteroidales bacterium]|nr:molybdopterin molybdotransferase MoeA [Bacteroidales bacterium]
MITFEEALALVDNVDVKPVAVQAALDKVVGRVLAEDVFSDVDMPPFNKSAVDGYACRRSELPGPFTMLETIPAGVLPNRTVAQGQCSKIMTGAMVPEGADTVIMVEYTEILPDGRIRFLSEKTSSNIAWQAEDVKAGQMVLHQGTLLRPHHIAILAAIGCGEPLVYKLPVIGVISTGDELVEPWEKPAPGQIRNSNSHQLMAQASEIGLPVEYFGIAPDTPEGTRDMILKGFSKSDILLLTGGVSMGDFDFVPGIMKELGIDIKFKSIAVQPGRPTIFGIRGDQFMFGLPGNPVSSYVQFELLVKQLAYRMMGHRWSPRIVKLPMASEYIRRKADRKSFMPVRINSEGKIEPLEYHGSAHIHAYEGADGIMSIEIGETHIPAGDLRDVRQL